MNVFMVKWNFVPRLSLPDCAGFLRANANFLCVVQENAGCTVNSPDQTKRDKALKGEAGHRKLV